MLDYPCRRAHVNLSRGSNNFELLRLIAAFAVIVAHSNYLLGSGEFKWDPSRFIFNFDMGKFGVYTFFCISGFLISHSWEKKKNSLSFMLSRILRIYPAAIIVILITIFVVGPMFSSLPFNVYIQDPITAQYFQNLSLFRMYYYLPGVFEHHFTPSVNGSLWTLPYELTAYSLLFILGLSQLLKKWYSILALHAVIIMLFLFFKESIDTIVIPIIGIDFKTFLPLFLFFISGMTYYSLRNKIRFHFSGTVIILIVLFTFRNSTYSFLLNSIFLPYIIYYLAFSRKIPFKSLYKTGDYSYGFYLYAFPIQQIILHLLPDIKVLPMILLSIIAIFPLAFFSWHAIERPALRLKQKFTK